MHDFCVDVHVYMSACVRHVCGWLVVCVCAWVYECVCAAVMRLSRCVHEYYCGYCGYLHTRLTVCYSVLQCVAVCCSVLRMCSKVCGGLRRLVCCKVLDSCVTRCCKVLCCRVLQNVTGVAVCCTRFKVRGGVLQGFVRCCVAGCSSVSHTFRSARWCAKIQPPSAGNSQKSVLLSCFIVNWVASRLSRIHTCNANFSRAGIIVIKSVVCHKHVYLCWYLYISIDSITRIFALISICMYTCILISVYALLCRTDLYRDLRISIPDMCKYLYAHTLMYTYLDEYLYQICINIYLNIFCVNIYLDFYIWMNIYTRYGMATIRRLLKIVSLFCKRALQKRLDSAKENINLKEPTHRSHPICVIIYLDIYT